MLRCSIRCLCAACLLAGCSVKPEIPTASQTMSLTYQLRSLDPAIPQAEAYRLSSDLFKTTATLVKRYKLTAPPLWHNFLVNIGLRKRGLCYHWSDALYSHFSSKEYPHFAFHLAGANIGEYWREHNALVVTSKKGKVENGVVIDPWRNSGRLYFSKVREDKSYHWRHRPKRECR